MHVLFIYLYLLLVTYVNTTVVISGEGITT
jgi:hypothetical protein